MPLWGQIRFGLLVALPLVVLAGPTATAWAGSGPIRLVGARTEYVVRRGDTLTSIGGWFGVDARTIARRNNRALDGRLHPGDVLVIDARHLVPGTYEEPLVINLPQRTIFVTTSDGRVEPFAVALGRPTWRTPLGPFTVVTKETQPTWDVPLSIQEEMRRAGREPLVRVPPSPENPLGDYWIGLSLPGVGIHGTNAPTSIYSFATHGCIRVHPDRIKSLFDMVQVGTRGRIVYEPALVAEQDGRVYVEIHRDIYRHGVDALEVIRARAERDGLLPRINWPAVVNAVSSYEGLAVDVTRENGGG